MADKVPAGGSRGGGLASPWGVPHPNAFLSSRRLCRNYEEGETPHPTPASFWDWETTGGSTQETPAMGTVLCWGDSDGLRAPAGH